MEALFTSLSEYPSHILEAIDQATLIAQINTIQRVFDPWPGSPPKKRLSTFLNTLRPPGNARRIPKAPSFKTRYDINSKLLNIQGKSEDNFESLKYKSIDFKSLEEHQKSYDLFNKYSQFKRNRRIKERRSLDRFTHNEALSKKSPTLLKLEHIEDKNNQIKKEKEELYKEILAKKKEYSRYVKSQFEPTLNLKKKEEVGRRLELIKNERMNLPKKEYHLVQPIKPRVPSFGHYRRRKVTQSEVLETCKPIDYLSERRKKKVSVRQPRLKFPDLHDIEDVKRKIKQNDKLNSVYEHSLRFLSKPEKMSLITQTYISSIKAKLEVITTHLNANP